MLKFDIYKNIVFCSPVSGTQKLCARCQSVVEKNRKYCEACKTAEVNRPHKRKGRKPHDGEQRRTHVVLYEQHLKAIKASGKSPTCAIREALLNTFGGEANGTN